jgi:hypothetical protein
MDLPLKSHVVGWLRGERSDVSLGTEGSTDGVVMRWLGVVEDGHWDVAGQVRIDRAIGVGA